MVAPACGVPVRDHLVHFTLVRVRQRLWLLAALYTAAAPLVQRRGAVVCVRPGVCVPRCL